MLQNLQISTGQEQVTGSDYDYLRLSERPKDTSSGKKIRTLDLFAGCGGTALGVEAACQSLGLRSEIAWAIDFEASACRVFADNFPDATVVHGDIQHYLSNDLEGPLTDGEKRLRSNIGLVDILIGGPPCQGHSDLNNYSRRNDKKNGLYLYMARAAKVFRPQHIVIENVQGLPHDRSGVLESTLSTLEGEGYSISTGRVDLARLGVPQRRRRHIVLASLSGKVRPLEEIVRQSECEERNVEWAIKDLMDRRTASIADTPSTPSKDNRGRIDYLFSNDLYDLPNKRRPPCHRDKKQTYKSVYGRLQWSRPSQTITSGFYSMCMGRYVHPERKRTLTGHEAARLQFFPDFFRFDAAGTRTALAKIVGNAVPMKLSYVLARELLCER